MSLSNEVFIDEQSNFIVIHDGPKGVDRFGRFYIQSETARWVGDITHVETFAPACDPSLTALSIRFDPQWQEGHWIDGSNVKLGF